MSAFVQFNRPILTLQVTNHDLMQHHHRVCCNSTWLPFSYCTSLLMATLPACYLVFVRCYRLFISEDPVGYLGLESDVQTQNLCCLIAWVYFHAIYLCSQIVFARECTQSTRSSMHDIDIL